MRLVILLITINIGYITTKSIYPNSCDDSPENDPKLNISKDKRISNTEYHRHKENVANNYNTNNDLDNDKVEINNPSVSKQFIMNHNNPIHTGLQTMNINNIHNHKQFTTPYPVFYGKVDPKLIITSQLYNPNSNRRSDTDQDVRDAEVEETISLDLLDPNFDLSNITDGRRAEDLVTKADEKNNPDFFNIRELREHLLDHLLDYFLNIIKDEQSNETIKRNDKDFMKVEDKLRNYYDSHHIDLFIDQDEESDYEDDVFNSPDHLKKNYKEKTKLDNEFYVSSENDTEIHENGLDIIENITEHELKNNSNSEVNDTSSSDDLGFNIHFNTESLHDLTDLVSANETNNHTVSLENTEKDLTEEDDSNENVFKIHTHVVTTEASLTTVKTDVATVNKDITTQYQDFEKNDSMEDDQIDEYMYNDEIDEYEQNKNNNDETLDENNEENITFNSDEDREIIAIKKDDNANTTNKETNYNDFNTSISNLNANKSIKFVVHLQNIDSTQIDETKPVNTTQILTILKKIKQDYTETGNNTKHIKNKHKSMSNRRHCKKSILLNLNINVV